MNGVSLLIDENDDEIFENLLWCFALITKKENTKIQLFIDSGLFTYVIKSLEYNNNKIVTPSIRIVGNISSGTAPQTQYLLDKNILKVLSKVLDNEDVNIEKEVF